jgi:acetyl esterase/lipase
MKIRVEKIVALSMTAVLTCTIFAGCSRAKQENTSSFSSTTSPVVSNSMPTAGTGGMGGIGGEQTGDTSTMNTKYLDVVYAVKSSSEKLDVYLPKGGSGTFPVIICVHGGAFKSGDKTKELDFLSAALESGYAVISVNYRLSSEAIFPAAINDVKAAIRFIRANAATYNINADKIALWGGSAGGNLVSLAGTTAGTNDLYDVSLGNETISDDVLAVVDWFGPIYFSTMDAEFTALGSSGIMGATNSSSSPESAYLGETIGSAQAETLVKQASPQTYITKDDPAFFIQHGTADRNIPITQSVNFAKSLTDVLGASNVTFEKLEGAGHGTSEFRTTDNITKILKWLDDIMK